MSEVPQDVRDSMNAIVNYNWLDELFDYKENNQPEGHVFEHLQRVVRWLGWLAAPDTCAARDAAELIDGDSDAFPEGAADAIRALIARYEVSA